MSSTNRGAERRDSDFYPTPSWAVHRLLEKCALPGGHWLEGAAGEGAIIKAVNSVRSDIRWTACEMRKHAQETLESIDGVSVNIGNFLGADLEWLGAHREYDVLITNPPFSHAMAFIAHGLTLANHVVMLLRQNFTGTSGRSAFMRMEAPDLYQLPERPAFDPEKDGTDSTEYAWFHWGMERGRALGQWMMLDSTPLAVRKEAKREIECLPADIRKQLGLFESAQP